MSIAHNAKYNSDEWIGKEFNHLTVIGYKLHYDKNGEKSWRWIVRCDCGQERLMSPWSVQSGKNVSCGCVRKSIGKIINAKHNACHTRLYAIWSHMIQRCEMNTEASKKTIDYKRYCGRGIKVCDEWHDYETFAKWAADNGYEDELSIERIDNDGNYCPENCKWIKQPLQARNRGTTLWVEYHGRRMSLAEACEIACVPYKRAFSRIKYMNWPVEDALSIPVDETRKWKRSDRFCNNL